MTIYAVCNLKGGVAKTTTTVNLAADLARDHNKRVLVIDADSQANTTAFFQMGKAEVTLANLLRIPPMERTKFSSVFCVFWNHAAICGSRYRNVDVLPADSSLMDLDLSKVEDNRVFTTVLRDLRPELETLYDCVLIDCPPAFNAASAAALLAADAVIIPIKLDAFALEGMANLMQQLQNMRRINPRLRVAGLLPVMWYKSEEIARAEQTLRGGGLPVYPHIRRSNLVDVMTFRQEPLIVCSPTSGACRDYRRLAGIVAEELGKGKRIAAAPSAPRNDRGEDRQHG